MGNMKDFWCTKMYFLSMVNLDYFPLILKILFTIQTILKLIKIKLYDKCLSFEEK